MGQDNTTPAIGGFSITPHDTTALSSETRALWIGTAGNISVRFVDGTVATLVSVSGLIPLALTHVKSTDTTADNIVGLY